jgi:hypothetical protein
MRKIKRPPSWIAKKAKRGFKGYPVATLALYGPTAALATKIAVSIIPDERGQPDHLERWFPKTVTSATITPSQRRSMPFSVSMKSFPWPQSIASSAVRMKKAWTIPTVNLVPSAPFGQAATASRMSGYTKVPRGVGRR